MLDTPSSPPPQGQLICTPYVPLLLPGVSLASCVGIFAPQLHWEIDLLIHNCGVCSYPRSKKDQELTQVLTLSACFPFQFIILIKGVFSAYKNNGSQLMADSLLILFTSSIWKEIARGKAPFSWDLSVALETPSFENVRWTIKDQGCQFQVCFCPKTWKM